MQPRFALLTSAPPVAISSRFTKPWIHNRGDEVSQSRLNGSAVVGRNLAASPTPDRHQLKNRITQMDQTPIHEQHNADLLAFIPVNSKRLVEVGCSSGALAREYKKINIDSHYTGIEISALAAELAKRYCDTVLLADIEHNSGKLLSKLSAADCWIFGDCLEHLRDPWALLRNIRNSIHKDASVVACIPNAQHWSLQMRLNSGEFRYEEIGLMDKTHLRWFTRTTMVELFSLAGFQIVAGMPRIFDEPHRDKILPAIRFMAELAGINPEIAVADALPMQYVIRAVPV